ncbi:citryl-CoA lyase [Methanobrevibacter sp. TMH8]|uniref:citryl-CoA lyase n=1 Tax=Methanobrevibacter sp. TMH8 TaxID=2848611 RepID=UPI001CCA6D3D|nr:citryl-CoA lyase [Methanobrevibacter sp. TMH8]MBZ9569949.1 citryl-CoA lyase [Methanobrevibacter sp. TMH8]
MTNGDKIKENSINNDLSKIKTAITDIESNKIVTRGYSQEDLIANITFPDMVYLLLKGDLPSPKESKMFNHVLISFCDHGVTSPSTQTSRLIASSGSPLNVALSGGLLSFGKKHAGAIEDSMSLFQEALNDDIFDVYNFENYVNSKDFDNSIDEIANDIVDIYLNDNKKIPGFGHRYHTKDPRGAKLMDIVREEDFIGKHTKLALAIEKILFEKKGIHINIDGANGAILSDMGFSSSLGLGIFMIGRIPGILAHVNEEITQKEGFRKFCNIDDISYCGYEDKHLD